jgi:hypothetical protein
LLGDFFAEPFALNFFDFSFVNFDSLGQGGLEFLLKRALHKAFHGREKKRQVHVNGDHGH